MLFMNNSFNKFLLFLLSQPFNCTAFLTCNAHRKNRQRKNKYVKLNFEKIFC